MKKQRDLTGMSVTEFRAKSQAQLFYDLAKFAQKGHGIESVHLDYLGGSDIADSSGRNDIAIVVWA